jgi:hypothetical protein
MEKKCDLKNTCEDNYRSRESIFLNPEEGKKRRLLQNLACSFVPFDKV